MIAPGDGFRRIILRGFKANNKVRGEKDGDQAEGEEADHETEEETGQKTSDADGDES
jgi:hypothetical protein